MYDIEIIDYTKIVNEGEVFEITYEVENTGSSEDTQTIEFTTSTVSGVIDSDIDVNLEPGETYQDTFTYDTEGEPVEEENTATVSSDDDSEQVTFFIAVESFFETIDELEDGETYEFQAAAEDDSGIDTGETVTTETVKRDLGTVTTDQIDSEDISQLELSVSGSVDTVGDYGEVGFEVFFQYREEGASAWDSTSRQSASATGSFTETITGLTEEVTYEVRIVGDFGGDEVTGSTVTATTLAPVFDFTIDNINDFLKEGRTLSIDYTVENTGTVESTQDLNLAFDTDTNVVDSAASVTVGSGSTSSGTFTFDTTGQTEGVYDIYLFGAEGVTQSSVEILVNSLVEFLAPAANEIVADRSPELECRLDIEGSGTVEVKFDGETVDTLNAPFDNVTQVFSLSDLDRDNQSKNWNIVYTGGQTDRDVTRSFVTGFVLKETVPEVI